MRLIDSYHKFNWKTRFIPVSTFIILALFILQGCAQPAQDSILEDSTVDEQVQPGGVEQEDEAEPEPINDTGEEDSYPPIATLAPDALVELLAEAQERDQVVVINFWATWCPPCLAEMPYFIRFYEEYDQDKVLFLSITADHIDTLETAVRPYQEQENLPFPIYVLVGMDPTPYSEKIGFELSGALPVTIIYDNNGELVQSWEREIKYEELEEAVNPLLQTPSSQ